MHHFTGLNFEQDIIDLDWEILDLCNYKCSYCYNKNSQKRCKLVPKGILDKAMDAFEESRCKICLDTLGGEPSLHPQLPYILERCSQSPVYSNIVITTNNSRFIETPRDPRIAINASLHASLCSPEQYVKHAYLYAERGVKFTAVIMIEYDSLEIIRDVIKRLEPIKDAIDIEPIYIYDSRSQIEVKDAALQLESLKQFSLDGEELTLHEVYSKGLNRFKGWLCNPMKHSLTTDGVLIRGCQCVGTLADQPHYFRDFEAKPMLCGLDVCVQDCNLVAPKVSL